MHDDFDAPAQAPTDFPADPVFYHDGVLLTVAGWVTALVVIAVFAFRAAQASARTGLFQHKRSVQLMERAVRRGLPNTFAKPDELTPDVLAMADEICGRSRQCAKEIGDLYGSLEKALSGVKEVDAPAGGLHAVGQNTGTIINIAVSNGQVGDAVPPAIAGNGLAHIGGQPAAVAPPGHAAGVYMALNAVLDEWKLTRDMTRRLEDAADQLMNASYWAPPPPPARSLQTRG